jgi:Holliday junction resolvase-like predicted endonuclease
MSAKDKYHDTVVHALQKDSWEILKEQYRFVLDNRRLWIDIRAANDESSRVIFVEVKSL